MVWRRLGVAAENSGKLVTTVRREARRIAEQGDHPLIVDGPPGIGCPVIASVTGADAGAGSTTDRMARRTRHGRVLRCRHRKTRAATSVVSRIAK